MRSEQKRSASIGQREQAIEAELASRQLREARGATQENVAERMNVTQSNVSHFERNPNIFLRSLAGYVEAVGGRLEVCAVFPDQVVTLAVPGPQRQQPDPPQREQAVGS